MASILMPNQGAVMLWQTCRSAAITLSAALAQSFHRLTAHKRHALPVGVDVDIQVSFKKDVLAVMPPKKPEKKAQVQAAA
jgi:HSP20 family molecular chaperone IbpA